MRVLEKVKRTLVLLVGVLCIPCLECQAETTNDFKALYNEELKAGLQELLEAYTGAVSEMESVRSEVVAGEHANLALSQAVVLQKQQQEKLDGEILGLLNAQQQLQIQMQQNFYGVFELLISYDAEYKTNAVLLDDKLKERNRFTELEFLEIDYETLGTLEKEVAKLQAAYDATVNVAELGVVTGVQFPLERESEIRSSYGIRIDPMNPATTRFHAGVDLKAAEGTKVLAIFNGTVAEAGWGPIGGYYVKIDHGDGIGSYYCHLSKLLCSKGQKVSQYDIIALSGNTGSRTTGPHLHFALYIDGVSVDPAVIFCQEE